MTNLKTAAKETRLTQVDPSMTNLPHKVVTSCHVTAKFLPRDVFIYYFNYR